MDGNTLREGIFSLHTRRVGKVAELLIKRQVGLGKSRSQFHDLYDDMRDKRVEVKFSCVRRKNKTLLTERTVMKCIEEADSDRHLAFGDWRCAEFDSNIQQVKRAEFDILYYGLFFYDCVQIFRIRSEEIGTQINYSDKQHKGNVGEGQFHINQDTLQAHLDLYHYNRLTYDELYELLTE